MVSYAVHYELSRNQDSVLQDFSRMRIEAHREQPVLYVAMATWIPKCNMYHQNNSIPESQDTENYPVQSLVQVDSQTKHAEIAEISDNSESDTNSNTSDSHSAKIEAKELCNDEVALSSQEDISKITESSNETTKLTGNVATDVEEMEVSEINSDNKDKQENVITLDDSDDKSEPSKEETTMFKKSNLEITPRKVSSPKQVQKKIESEKKRQQRQKEKEEKEKKKQEEKERIRQEKMKKKEEKQKELEQKQKEKELKEEQKKKEREEKEEIKRKEREEKEQKKKEKEEKEEQKRKEREQEKLKKQQEIEEKNKEKQKEEELKQKTAAAFVNFFVPKKSDVQEEKKAKVKSSAFMEFEVKSDMKLPPARRNSLSESEKNVLKQYIENQNEKASYIEDLKSGKQIGKSNKTWPFEELLDDDDVAIVEEEGHLGESIYEDKSKLQKFRAKFLKFHENRRPAYFGTWRKKSSHVKPRRPFAIDEVFNYEEDSDDDWEEEEQGESLNGSEDEADKENEDEKDDYEVDNEFFVPHGHLSEDEIDDEESARLSPESLKQKLKLLKDEFDLDMQLKTHKLKPRSIGCIWYNRDGSNVEEAIQRYLQPLAMITNGQIQIKKRSEIFPHNSGKKNKPLKELNPEHIPLFLKVIHGNSNKKRVLIEQFMTYMTNNGFTVDISKAALLKNLKVLATWKRCKDNGPLKNKFCWMVNEDNVKKYNVSLSSSHNSESDSKK